MKILDKNTALLLISGYGQRIRKNTKTLAFPFKVKCGSQALSERDGGGIYENL